MFEQYRLMMIDIKRKGGIPDGKTSELLIE
jgi:hypothetical protein